MKKMYVNVNIKARKLKKGRELCSTDKKLEKATENCINFSLFDKSMKFCIQVVVVHDITNNIA